MRYLTISKSGIWYFRFQIATEHRHLFDNRSEIKRSLHTSDKNVARIKALTLELSIRSKVHENVVETNDDMLLPPSPISSPKRQLLGACPYECLDKYYLYKSDFVTTKTNDDSKKKCQVILDLMGIKEITKIRRKEAESVRKLLNDLPSNISKHKELRGLTPLRAIKANKKLGKPLLNAESIKYYIHKCSSFFEWAVINEYTDINPFKGFRLKTTFKASEAKNAYSSSELKKLFSTSLHAQESSLHHFKFWLPIIASVTGARLNEICQLYKDDIIQVDGIWCFNISDKHNGQKLKNINSHRIIPIHSKLIELGFLEMLPLIAGKRLFPDLELKRDGYGTSASRWFGRFKTKLGFSKGHDFHSFRHTVANELKQLAVPQERTASILGHAQQGITYERYGKGFTVEVLKQTIESIPTTHLKHLQVNKKKKHENG